MSNKTQVLINELNIYATKIQELEEKSKNSLIIRKSDFTMYADLYFLYTKTREQLFDLQLMNLKKRSIWRIILEK